MIALGSLFMSTSVSADLPTSYGGSTASQIYNLGLLQHQMMIFVTGVAAIVAGIALAAAGVVVDAVSLRVVTAPIANFQGAEATIDAVQAAAAEPELSPEDLAERDRNLNRTTFMIAAGMVAIIGIVFLAVLAST